MKTLKDIRPGQTVGRYEFLVPIAQGGMAAVWAARQRGSRGFSKTVAVKTMLPTISDDPRFEQMFLNEARIASRIRHPNVAEILDLGEQDDVLYLVIEWVDGEALNLLSHTAVEKDPFPLPIALRILCDACAGLHAAHELLDEDGSMVGLVHRDISPQNILVGYDGVVKLVDFGVAKTAGRTAETTNVGQVKGKPPYMSPEQALGKTVDRRTDLFALGIVLYQLATGRHPMRGETDVATLHNIVSNQPILPPGVFNSTIPMQLERVIMKSLARDPDLRFQTAREFELALEEVTHGPLPRVRTEEVGRFVNQLLGDQGEARRAAVRESIRLADERALTPRFRTTGDEVTVVGLRESIPDVERDGHTPAAMPDRVSRYPSPHYTNLAEETVVDQQVKEPRRLPWSLGVGITVGMIISGVAFWSFTRPTSLHADAAPIVPLPTLSPSALPVAPTSASVTSAPLPETGAVDAGATATIAASASPVATVRHQSTRVGPSPSSQNGVGVFKPPPVNNPGF